MVLRWGIAGGGRISHDFVTAAKTHPTGEFQFVAVADPWKDTALKFAKDHGISKVYADYAELAADNAVDIVYVGNINPQHYQTTKLMLEHGKHVLCEKPLTLNEKQTRKLCSIAKENNLFLMEGYWSRSTPVYQELRRIIDSGEIGELVFVSVNFGQALQHIERVISKELGGGSIMDLGCYILQFLQFLFRGMTPQISVNGHLNKNGTDESFGAIFKYPDGKMAVVSTSARVGFPNEATLVFTKGTMQMSDFWCPIKLVTPSGLKDWPLPDPPVPYLHHNSGGLMYQAEEVRQCVLAGKTECPLMTLEESLELAQQRDYLRHELGVYFSEDSQEF